MSLNLIKNITLSNTAWKLVLDGLVQIRAKRDYPYQGICSNLDAILSGYDEFNNCYAYAVIEQLAQGWRHHSGDNNYPVEGGSRHYRKGGWNDRWNTDTCEYAALRLDLLEHCITKVEQILEPR